MYSTDFECKIYNLDSYMVSAARFPQRNEEQIVIIKI